MKSSPLIKHYLPILLVFLIGVFLSFFAQHYIVSEDRQQKLAAFETLASTSTAKLQDEKRRHLVILNTLSAAISGYPQIISSSQFDLLSAQIMSDIPALNRLLVVTTTSNTDSGAIKVPVSSNPESWYKIDYAYPKQGIGKANTISKVVYNYRALSANIGLDTTVPTIGYLIGEINVDIAFSSALSDIIPAWLDIYIYKHGANGEPEFFYSYPPNPDHASSSTQINPTQPPNKFAIYHPHQVKTDTDSLSILYLPRDNTFFEPNALTKWGPLLSGLLLTLIATIYLHTLLKRSDTITALVKVRTQELLEAADSLREESHKRQDLVDQLSESDKQLRAVINSVDGMFWERDLTQDRFNFISEHVEKLMGYTKEDVLDDVNLLMSRFLPEYEKKFQDSIRQAKEEDEPLQLEAQTRRADNQIIWVRIIYSVVFANGQPAKVRGVTMDVTKYKKMGEERGKLMESISQSQQKLTSLINSIDGVLWQFNLDPPQYTYVSKQVENFLGCNTKDILDDPQYIKKRVVREDAEHLRKELPGLFSQDIRSRNVEFRLIRDDGKLVYIRNIVTPIMEHGEVTSFHGVMLDVTREKKMQEEHDSLSEQLKQAQKLESIGQLAAGIAHEINTPTQFVGDNIRYLQDSFEDLRQLYELYSELLHSLENGGDNKPFLEKIKLYEKEIDLAFLFKDIPSSIEQSLEGTTRIRDIVKAMKEFSHPGSTCKVQTDLNRAIESTITVARNEWKYLAEMETELADDLPAVMLLPGEFNQVILNIIVNAAHAIEEKRTHSESDKLGTIKIRTEQQDNSILISISDTGNGIPENIKERVFDPFFTTKQVGKGTGQGLAIAYSVVVDKHQGKITVESTPGEGTTFYIKLPIENTLEIPQTESGTPTAMAS